MKYILYLLLLIYPFFGYSFNNFVEVSYSTPNSFQVTLSKVRIGELELGGELFCNVTRGRNFSLYKASINNLAIGDTLFKPMEARVIIKEKAVVINYIRNKEFLIRGKIDFSQNRVAFNVNLNTSLTTENFAGKVKGTISVEGKLNNPLFKGTLSINNGRYLDTDFPRAEIKFMGFLPYLRVNNSEVTLSGGRRYQINGFVDIRDLKTILTSSELVSKEAHLGEWKVLTEEREVGLVKKIDERMGVLFGGYINKKDEEELGGEFRYKISDDNFLKLRMEKKQSILGFERRKEF